MIKNKFLLVGKDFPVFINPLTKEEYAIARKERKIKKGHKGFKCYFSKKIKIKTDIYRRDITINSIKLNSNGKICKKYIKDIKNKIIKNISPSFQEDPLRILRLSRFQNKYYKKGFLISSKTYFLTKKITKKKEITHLSKTRILKEINKTINIENLHCFININKLNKSLIQIIKDLYIIIKISQNFYYNNYINHWLKICNLIKNTQKYNNNYNLTIILIIIKSLFFLKKFFKKKYYLEKLNIKKKLQKYVKLIFKIEKINNYKINNSNKKEKIKTINSLMIKESEIKYNKKIFTFYKKYIILELLNLKNTKNIKKIYKKMIY